MTNRQQNLINRAGSYANEATDKDELDLDNEGDRRILDEAITETMDEMGFSRDEFKNWDADWSDLRRWTKGRVFAINRPEDEKRSDTFLKGQAAAATIPGRRRCDM